MSALLAPRLVPGTPPLECRVDPTGFPHPSAGSVGTIPGVGQWSEALGHTPELLRVTEAPELVALCGRLFGEPASTWYKKWLRTVPPGEPLAPSVLQEILSSEPYTPLESL